MMNETRASLKSLVVAAVGMLLAAGVTSGAALADPADTGWQIRFYVAGVDMDPASSGVDRPVGTTRRINSASGGGVGVNAEYRLSRWLGIDLGLFGGGSVDLEAASFSVGRTGTVVYDSLTFTPLTLGLDVHLTPDGQIDFYVCPLVALIQYGSLSTVTGNAESRFDIDFDEDVAPGLGLGLGVPFGEKRWSFQANLTYIDSSLDGRGVGGVRIASGYDMTILGVGFGYRFKPRSG